MPADWPLTVNQDYIFGTYREVPESNVVAFRAEVGPPKLRRRTTARTSLIQWQARMSAEEVETFDDWYRNIIKDGSLSFYRRHPRTGETVEFTFAPESDPIIERIAPAKFSVTIAVRQMP